MHGLYKILNLKTKVHRSEMYRLIGISVLLLFLSYCGVKEKKFNKTTWNERDDIFYLNRESMVNDLMKNHLRKGMTYNDLIELIGNPENYANMERNTIGYEILVDYGWDIDPVEGKTLFIRLSNDSIIVDYYLEHWGN